MTNTYPVGNVVLCRFAFTTRALTNAELATFLAGGGLPAGIGVTPATVSFDYAIGQAAKTTLTGSQITTDATGAYHVNLNVTTAGQWRYRGYGVDGSANPVACTPDVSFMAVRTF